MKGPGRGDFSRPLLPLRVCQEQAWQSAKRHEVAKGNRGDLVFEMEYRMRNFFGEDRVVAAGFSLRLFAQVKTCGYL